MARGCLQGVKYLMFAFNLLFWLGGCGILGVGIWLAATQGNFATLSSSFPSLSAANLLIVTGTFVMAIGFVGCIGAIKENKCLLLTLPQVSSTCQMFPLGLGPLGAVGRVWLRPLGWRRKLGRGRGPDPGLSHGVTWSSEASACWGSVGPGGGGIRSGTPGEDRARSPGPVPSPHSVQGPHGASGASKSGVAHLSWLLALPPALLSGGATWRERRCRQAPLLSLVVASGLCLWVPEWSLPL
ncbi:tetraspanin-4 isoform X6 [Phocoena sinus]|nr:tetraspanin-4 isoform X6 [Phocoena sinus]XP_032495033.1 tetraspanin-4 isoform X6 [Phocoena sinus]XP_032495034.1 tetraspanin-4 isoform X6 [Phocoena sinus]XP_032495035.1 tetraspanin-4 isoform X6 [Phocoena sinus]